MRLLIPSDLHAACAKAVVATATDATEGPFVLPFDLSITLRGSVKRGAEFVQSYPGTLTTLDLVTAACAMSGAIRPVFERIALDPAKAQAIVRDLRASDEASAKAAFALVDAMRWNTTRTVAGKRTYSVESVEVRQ